MPSHRAIAAALIMSSLAAFLFWLGAVAGYARPQETVVAAPCGRQSGCDVLSGGESTSSAASVASLSDVVSLRKIDPVAFRELVEDGSARLIIEARGQANLSFVASLSTASERRWAVVDSLRRHAAAAQRDLLGFLSAEQRRGQVGSVQQLWIINAVALTATMEAVMRLAEREDVAFIRFDQQRQWLPLPVGVEQNEVPSPNEGSTPWNLAQIGAERVRLNLGIDGAGVVIASLDTGVDLSHPALSAGYRGRENGALDHSYSWFVTTGEQYLTPVDRHGHGTHTTGIMAGHGIGVAPGARWIAVKVLADDGTGYDGGIHLGLQWLLAPGGDPERAPHIANASWGSPHAARTLLRADVAALRAAGILPVFAAGNNGVDGPGSVGSPASYPESFAAGASDDLDRVAYFSGRGPSPWGQIKPQVIAPGVLIRSAWPGGGYATESGTSQAAPHVSGLAALVWQAAPHLALAQVEYVITSTAAPVGAAWPNDSAGWGRIDAYAAVLSLTDAGLLTGVVEGGPDLISPIIIAESKGGHRRVQIVAAADGAFAVTLGAGEYTVTASAFGFAPATASAHVSNGQVVSLSFTLHPLPRAQINGVVRDAATGQPLTARIEALDTPVKAVADADGRFSLRLPAGVYTLRLASPRHKWTTTTVAVRPGRLTEEVVIDLQPAPRLLLVDSGAWYYESSLAYFAAILDDLHLPFDSRQIIDSAATPALEDLSPYDVVIWSSPRDSPGYVGGDEALGEYLGQGGRVLLTGQDIAYWDGGGAIFGPAAYFTRYLHVQYVSDRTEITHVVGLDAGPLQGINLRLNAPDSARNQTSADVITTTANARPVALYADDGGAGAVSLGCYPYRAMYLAFGLEGAGPLAARRLALERAVAGLLAPGPPVAASIAADGSARVGRPGEGLSYIVNLRNLGVMTDTYYLSLMNNEWPASLWNTGFTATLQSPIELAPCQAQSFGVHVRVPLTATSHVSDSVLVRASSTLSHALSLGVDLAARTPSAILLVDDDRWYDVRPAYEQALARLDYPYDVWNVATQGAPRQDILETYPVVIWFTGYDWFDPLSRRDQEALARYIERGGRIFLSGQDILDNMRLPSPLLDVLGIVTYTPAITVTTITAVAGHPIADGLDSYRLTYPYSNYSDHMTVTSPAAIIFVGDGVDGEGPAAIASQRRVTMTLDGQPVAPSVSVFGRGVFFAFPFEGLASSDATLIMDRIVRWLHPLAGSRLAASTAVAAPGQVVTYTVALRNSGVSERAAAVSAPLPDLTTYVPGSAGGGAAFDAQSNRIVWPSTLPTPVPGLAGFSLPELFASPTYGQLRPGETLTITYAARLAQHIAPRSVTTATVEIIEDTGLILRDWQRTDIDAPRIQAVSNVARPLARIGDVLTYRLAVSNTGTAPALLFITSTIPMSTTFVEGTATATTGNVRAAGMEVFWDAPLAVGAAAAMTFSVSASYPFTNGALLVSRADVDDGWHPPQRRNITTTIQAPDLTASRLESRPGWVGPKAPFSYTFVLRNTGAAPAVGASLVDPLPDQVMYGWSPLPGGMSFDPALWGLRWTGTLTPGQALTMSVGLSLHPGYVGTITNTAMLYDGLHPPLALEAQTIVPRQRWYLPVVIVDKASPR